MYFTNSPMNCFKLIVDRSSLKTSPGCKYRAHIDFCSHSYCLQILASMLLHSIRRSWIHAEPHHVLLRRPSACY